MSYRNYVLAAYCVFCIVLAWDFIAPRLALRAQVRMARLRASRAASRATANELNR